MTSVDKRIELLKGDELVFKKAGYSDEEVVEAMKRGIVVMIKEIGVTAEDFKKNKEFFEKYSSVDITANRIVDEVYHITAFEDIEYQFIKRTVEALKQAGIKFEINFLNRVEWEEKE